MDGMSSSKCGTPCIEASIRAFRVKKVRESLLLMEPRILRFWLYGQTTKQPSASFLRYHRSSCRTYHTKTEFCRDNLNDDSKGIVTISRRLSPSHFLRTVLHHIDCFILRTDVWADKKNDCAQNPSMMHIYLSSSKFIYHRIVHDNHTNYFPYLYKIFVHIY